ncbi:MAG TPA: preprotein translocase subunit YajC [Chthoniobacterales bacterium]
MLNFLAQAQAASSAGSGLIGMLPIVFIFVIAYYVMIRPQMRRQKEQQKLVSALKTGDRVVTASGIHGMITNVKETTVLVKVADNVKLEMDKTAVTNVVKTAEA